jgi:SAM-dependent methyltransferase
MTADWEARYNTEEYIFGKRPNRFLAENLPSLPPGCALSLGEGEGRNAVFLAQHGWQVTALDLSPSALRKTRRLAAEAGVKVATLHADLNDLAVTPNTWDFIICFFVHLPAPERAAVHRKVVAGLKPGGVYLLEGFAPAQLRFGDRGPKNIDQLYSLPLIQQELADLEFRIARETERLLDDAQPELGSCAVTQLLGVKPL